MTHSQLIKKRNTSLVSVTVVLRDTGPILEKFFSRVENQKTSFPFEIVALYFGDGDDTLHKIKKHKVRVIRIPRKSFSFDKSRDLVCSYTRGAYIVIISVDALPIHTDWLQKLILPMILNKADIVQGEVRCPHSKNPYFKNYFYWENNYWQYYSSEEKNFIKKYGNFGFSGVNLAFRKRVWQKTGFNGVSYCEDKIFQKRVFESGYKSIYSKNAAVWHAHSYSTVKEVFQRSANEGLGWREVGQHYGILLFFKDLFRFDMHMLAMKAFFKKRLKYNSEIWFFFIRPVALFWGNNFLTKIYN